MSAHIPDTAVPDDDVHSNEPPTYSLLNDQPVSNDDDDLLGSAEIAGGVASILVASRASSPFVLAVDAGWGMGKSTLLHQIEARLKGHPSVLRARFNAWTAEGENALEGLIKSVLVKLDGNTLRAGLRRLARQKRLMSVARLSSTIVGRFFGVSRMVDELWEQLKIDAKSRNELRDLIQKTLSDWAGRDATLERDRALVVFIDDLDRCSDEVVIKICEAVKLYLDAPGLIFVIACDQSVLARGVSASARGGTDEGRSYLEKIVQIVYRVPPPEEGQVKDLIRGYARRSGTTALMDDTVTEILARQTGRNPRRIKRIINSFILEHQLDPAWRKPPLGSAQLVTAILLQHLYTSFYDLLRRESRDDPIAEFLTYAEVRGKAFASDDKEWWDTVCRTFQEHRLQPPEPGGTTWATDLQRLDGELPEEFPKLVRDETFAALLRGVGDTEAREALRAQLIRRPLATGATEQSGPLADPAELLTGWHVTCIDDNPDSLSRLVQMLHQHGASATIHDDPATADREISLRPPDAVISDITRGDDPNAGFEHITQLRSSGYQGPVIFFTGRVTPERRRTAAALHALGIVTSEDAVIDTLVRFAGESAQESSGRRG